MNHRASLLLIYVALLWPPRAAWAQENTVRVRLYAVHPPATLTFSGSGLQWRACERCPPAAADKLAIMAKNGQLRVEGSSLPRPRVFVAGSYRMAAESQQPVGAGYPLELRAQQERIVVIATMPHED